MPSIHIAHVLSVWQYTRQSQVVVRETPELYREVVSAYIAAFPPARTQWYALYRYWRAMAYLHSG